MGESWTKEVSSLRDNNPLDLVGSWNFVVAILFGHDADVLMG